MCLHTHIYTSSWESLVCFWKTVQTIKVHVQIKLTSQLPESPLSKSYHRCFIVYLFVSCIGNYISSLIKVCFHVLRSFCLFFSKVLPYPEFFYVRKTITSSHFIHIFHPEGFTLWQCLNLQRKVRGSSDKASDPDFMFHAWSERISHLNKWRSWTQQRSHPGLGKMLSEQAAMAAVHMRISKMTHALHHCVCVFSAL